jgi:hypothetical protein
MGFHVCFWLLARRIWQSNFLKISFESLATRKLHFRHFEKFTIWQKNCPQKKA